MRYMDQIIKARIAHKEAKAEYYRNHSKFPKNIQKEYANSKLNRE